MSEPEYRITAQPFITFHDPQTNQVVEGREVEFRDALTGVHGRVRVSLANYTPDHVRELIMADIHKIRAVAALNN